MKKDRSATRQLLKQMKKLADRLKRLFLSVNLKKIDFEKDFIYIIHQIFKGYRHSELVSESFIYCETMGINFK